MQLRDCLLCAGKDRWGRPSSMLALIHSLWPQASSPHGWTFPIYDVTRQVLSIDVKSDHLTYHIRHILGKPLLADKLQKLLPPKSKTKLVVRSKSLSAKPPTPKPKNRAMQVLRHTSCHATWQLPVDWLSSVDMCNRTTCQNTWLLERLLDALVEVTWCEFEGHWVNLQQSQHEFAAKTCTAPT